MEISIIKNEEQYKKYLSRMNAIFHAEEGSPESEELDLLALVLEKYEEEHYPIDAPNPIDAIRFIMEQMGLDDNDLGKILNSRSRASEILNKKRKLSIAHIRKLTEHLKIPADVLIKDYDLAS
ncbi:helix-turn-helix domain-containing protein [Arenibacter sp. GZD96]|uniref:helix-turn-helix domain-containing protein n=1 Tax=Aurantibrevibacter litoralis TaxID=3106030 RepID=UPI002AFE1682|nr:helix-turn-helix domain-containing protein [Arenibacter sp. GZD-96]MEA1785158.1 helix-turn-helix domain-containing protein [Arenibacter sp. GZD-96]